MSVPLHERWCERQAQPHPTCYRHVGDVLVAAEVTVVVELHKTMDVPALVSVTTIRGSRRSLLPLNIETAHGLGGLLDDAVRLLRPDS